MLVRGFHEKGVTRPTIGAQCKKGDTKALLLLINLPSLPKRVQNWSLRGQETVPFEEQRRQEDIVHPGAIAAHPIGDDSIAGLGPASG